VETDTKVDGQLITPHWQPDPVCVCTAIDWPVALEAASKGLLVGDTDSVHAAKVALTVWFWFIVN